MGTQPREAPARKRRKRGEDRERESEKGGRHGALSKKAKPFASGAHSLWPNLTFFSSRRLARCGLSRSCWFFERLLVPWRVMTRR